MKLLAIGGPKHGKELPYREGQRRLIVPIIPDLRAWLWDVGPGPYADLTIATGTYERRVVSDRVVWVFVG